MSLIASSRPERPRVLVVMPAYNEAAGIRATITGVADTLKALGLDWEIIVVDDGSTDDTAATVCEVDPSLHVSLLRLSRNFGKEAAITAGLDHANGDAVLIIDADGQHPVSVIPTMLQLWREGHDMVYAVRNDRQNESRFKRLGSQLFYRLMRSSGHIDIPADAGDFRWMDRCVVTALRALPERHRFMKGLYSWVGFRSVGVAFTPLPGARPSHYSRRRLTRLAWTGITSFSVLPLRIASLLGGLLATIAFAYGAYEAVRNLFFDVELPGWPTVVVSIMFFSGVQLMFIGILGEYLARVFEEVKGRPTYLVAQWHRNAASTSEKISNDDHASS
jgi:glycosyltransferase involved in cell wall biosynthesis